MPLEPAPSARDGALGLPVPPDGPARVCFAGDWHGRAPWARHVIRRAAALGAPTILQLGDFGVWPGPPGERYLDAVEAHLEESDALCLFLDGNHESFPDLYSYPVLPSGLRQLRPRLYHLPRGLRWQWQGLRFLALGGATSLDRPSRVEGVSWWPQEALTYAEAASAIEGGECDVMLTHDCPMGVTIPGIGGPHSWPIDELHRAWGHQRLVAEVVDVVRPTHLFHGHFHVRYDAELTHEDGFVTSVTGLDCDGSMTRGYQVVDLAALAEASRAQRSASGGSRA